MNNPYYIGERIYFRPIEMDDLADCQRWINDPEIRPFLMHRSPLNALNEKQWIESLDKSDDAYHLAIALKADDRPIGTTALQQISPVHRSAVLGLMVGEIEQQNKGYGTEAVALMIRLGFEELNLNRIGLKVFSHNSRAIHVYNKVGFVQEGCSRQAYFYNGDYHDELHFGMLREEWLARQQDRSI